MKQKWVRCRCWRRKSAPLGVHSILRSVYSGGRVVTPSRCFATRKALHTSATDSHVRTHLCLPSYAMSSASLVTFQLCAALAITVRVEGEVASEWSSQLEAIGACVLMRWRSGGFKPHYVTGRIKIYFTSLRNWKDGILEAGKTPNCLHTGR